MLNYSIPYIILLLLLFIISFFEMRTSNKTSIRMLLIIMYVLFFGFSGYVGTDWLNYKGYYDITDLFVWNTRDYEVSFSFIVKLFSHFNIDYKYFKIFIILAQALLLDRILSKYSSSLSLCYCILIASFPIVVLDLLRNFTALLIAVNAIPYFLDKKYIKAYMILLFSVTFHISTFIFWIIMPFLNKRLSLKALIPFLFVGLFIYVFQIHYIEPVLKLLANVLGGRISEIIQLNLELVTEGNSVYGLKIGILEKIFLILLVFYKYPSLSQNRDHRIFLNMFIFYILIYFYFSEMEVFINRFAVLFSIGYILTIPELIFSFKYKSNRGSLLVLVLVLLLTKTAISYNFQIYEYSNILYMEDDINKRIYVRSMHYI